jgi:hypothetical protein
MKKKLCLLLVAGMLLTGCGTQQRISEEEFRKDGTTAWVQPIKVPVLPDAWVSIKAGQLLYPITFQCANRVFVLYLNSDQTKSIRFGTHYLTSYLERDHKALVFEVSKYQ